MSRQRSGAGQSHRRPHHGASKLSIGKSAGGAEPSPAPSRSKPERAAAPSGLHIVSTPIGNLADITLRALDILAASDVIACEDTRVTGKLLKAHGIATPMTPYHEHNAARARPRLIERLKNGEIVALVSAAGTPLISDPGYRLVREASAAGVEVTAAPGPSAPLAALVLSGLPSDRFLFAGFLPPRRAARRTALGALARIDATLVMLEAPRRLAAALADMAEILGPREAAVARELTKLHEEVRRDSLASLAAQYAAEGPPKGEAVVIVGPPTESAGEDVANMDALLRKALRTMRVGDAAAAVAGATGRPRRDIYARALELASPGDGGEDR